MLAIQARNKLISKVVEMADGRIALVQFLVSFEAGELKAKVVSVQYKNDNVTLNTKPLVLCGECLKSSEIVSDKKYYQKIVSKYAQFAFLFSQPTRAPSC